MIVNFYAKNMEAQPFIAVKSESTDVKTEALENEDSDIQDPQINKPQRNSKKSDVQTVVLQNIQIQENGEIPIILNSFSNSNSDGNLQIDTLEDNVIHTYIIE